MKMRFLALKTLKVWLDLGDFNKLENPGDFYYEKFTDYGFTKIGGWPDIIQHQLEMNPKNMVFQIGSEDKAGLNWIDGGNVYIGFEEGEWKIECQFY